MAEPATTMFLANAGLQAVSSFMSGQTAVRNYDTEVAENRYNAMQERYAARQAYQEKSLNSSLTALNGRQDIAAGAAAMSAAGNIGTSAQTAVRQSAFNLDKDLAALDYKYANEAIQHKNLARMYDYNAGVAKRNKRDAQISSFLSPLISLTGSAAYGYSKGYLGKKGA